MRNRSVPGLVLVSILCAGCGAEEFPPQGVSSPTSDTRPVWQALALDQSYAYLPEEDFMAHGQILALPDGGTSLINLA